MPAYLKIQEQLVGTWDEFSHESRVGWMSVGVHSRLADYLCGFVISFFYGLYTTSQPILS